METQQLVLCLEEKNKKTQWQSGYEERFVSRATKQVEFDKKKKIFFGCY